MNGSFKLASNDKDQYSGPVIKEDKAIKPRISDTKFNPMLNFFRYDNGKFTINRDELMLIPEARKIIYADKGGKVKGDNDGRHKLWATQQFGVAWWVVNVNSPGIQAGLDGDELFRNAIDTLGVEDWDYKKDQDFQDFLAVYQNMYESAAYSVMLKQMLISFKDSANIIKAIRDNVMKLLKTNSTLNAEDIRALMASQKEIINLAGDIPNQISKLKQLQELVNKEEREIEIGRGNVTITESMKP